MFNYNLNPLSLTLAGLASLFFALVLSYFLHLRYDRQFGWGFMLIGMFSLGPPAVSVLGLTIYLIVESGLELIDILLMLSALLACCCWTLWRLRSRLLSKIFKPLSPEALKAMAERYAEEEKAREAEVAEKTKDQPSDNAAAESHG